MRHALSVVVLSAIGCTTTPPAPIEKSESEVRYEVWKSETNPLVDKLTDSGRFYFQQMVRLNDGLHYDSVIFYKGKALAFFESALLVNHLIITK